MKVPRFLKVTVGVIGPILFVAGLAVGSAWLYLHPKIVRTDAVVYGERQGRKLAFDILRPSNPNGLGILIMVSGGWKSGNAGSFQPWMVAPVLRRGYTVFPIYHVSQPDARVMEIFEDVTRAVRYIRYHAKEYGVDPQRLGVAGGSAGGHLSLLLATRGGPGHNNAADPVDRESSAVQAVAIFYPVTDLLNLGKSTENQGDGGPPKSFIKAFGPSCTNLVIWRNQIGREMSPIYFVHSNLPATLIYHGDADTLVPLDQSERYQAAAQKLGCEVKLVVHHGGGHGWWSMIWDIRRFAQWFDIHLRGQAAAKEFSNAPGTSVHMGDAYNPFI